MSGEERLASALEGQLKPPWALYRNVAWLEKRPGAEPQDGEADMVLAHPELGVMVIEIKGGRVQRIGGRWESLDRHGTAHRIKDPFAQVTGAMHRLKRVCEALPAWPSHDVRFTRAVCFPDAAYDRSMTPDGPREIVIDHDDLERVGDRVREIFAWWNASVSGGPPGATGMAALHELVARDLVIDSPLAAGVSADEARIALSSQQFGALDLLSTQRRALILGVAGSGKTLLAAEKARRLAAHGFEVLLTCFNRPLAEHLAATVGRLDRLTVSTFHRLSERLGQEAGIIGPDPAHDTAYFDDLPDVLDRALHILPEPRFDAIVVDEGQDLDSVWWLPLLDLLRDPERGIVYVFGDANQDLYHAREPSELGVVMPESPPTYHLNENRRSTRSIHEFAMRYAKTDAAAPAPIAVGPAGRQVEIFTYTDDSPDACRKVLATALRRVIDTGRVPASDVVVLTPRSPRSSWLMSPDGAPVEAWPYRLMPEYGPEGAVLPMPTRGLEVRVATIHRYKGLESAVVVLCEIDSRVDEAELASLLYVGATRARSHLVVVCSEPMVERLRAKPSRT
ncbi:MAG: AAA family ATPase [Chloroflexota bacterium]